MAALRAAQLHIGTFRLQNPLYPLRYRQLHLRVYAYEDDLPLVYSLGTYYGKGNALFVIVSYGLLENVKLAAKYETTWYGDRESVGSGNDLRQTSSHGSFHLGCVVQF